MNNRFIRSWSLGPTLTIVRCRDRVKSNIARLPVPIAARIGPIYPTWYSGSEESIRRYARKLINTSSRLTEQAPPVGRKIWWHSFSVLLSSIRNNQVIEAWHHHHHHRSPWRPAVHACCIIFGEMCGCARAIGTSQSYRSRDRKLWTISPVEGDSNRPLQDHPLLAI